MLDKKSLHEMERHMSVLTAPNYNLHLILREYLTGGTNSNSHLVLNSRGSKFKNKQSSKFLAKVSEFDTKKEESKELRAKNNLISSDELKFLENNSNANIKNENSFKRTSDAENYKNLTQKTDKQEDLLISKSADTKKQFGDEISNQIKVSEFVDANLLVKCSDIEKQPIINQDYSSTKNLSHKLIINNLQKHKRLLQREVKRLKHMIDETKAETEDTNKKCNIVAMEKIELIEENEAIDVEIGNIQKQKAELTNSNNTNSTEGNLNTVNSDPFTSTREISKGSNLSCNTAPNMQGIDMNKIKKIEDLKAQYSNMEKGLEEAKTKAKEKTIRNKQLISENNDLKMRIEQKKIVLQQYKSEMSYMKNKLDEKKVKESTPRKIFGVFKSIFKK